RPWAYVRSSGPSWRLSGERSVDRLDEGGQDPAGGTPDEPAVHLIQVGLEGAAVVPEFLEPARLDQRGQRELQDAGDLGLVRSEQRIRPQEPHERNDEYARHL